MRVCGHVATVTRQEGDHVLLSIPLAHVHEHFKLEPGDQVAVVNEGDGLIAVPHTRAVEVDRTEESGRTIRAANREYQVTEGTAQYGEGNRVILYVIQREDGESDRLFAIRRSD